MLLVRDFFVIFPFCLFSTISLSCKRHSSGGVNDYSIRILFSIYFFTSIEGSYFLYFFLLALKVLHLSL